MQPSRLKNLSQIDAADYALATNRSVNYYKIDAVHVASGSQQVNEIASKMIDKKQMTARAKEMGYKWSQEKFDRDYYDVNDKTKQVFDLKKFRGVYQGPRDSIEFGVVDGEDEGSSGEFDMAMK